MLNVNAEAFVPGGGEFVMASHVSAPATWFRYTVAGAAHSAGATSNSLLTLLGERAIVPDRGVGGDDALPMFVQQQLLVMGEKAGSERGFLLSRERLSFSLDVSAIHYLNAAPGYVMHVDTSFTSGVDAGMTLLMAWNALFSVAAFDLGVLAVGCCCVRGGEVGLTGARSSHYYFFVACSEATFVNGALYTLLEDGFVKATSFVTCMSPVSCVVPYACGLQRALQLCVCIDTRGDAAEHSVDERFTVTVSPKNMAATRHALYTLLDSVRELLVSRGSTWERPCLVELRIVWQQREEDRGGVSYYVGDVVRLVGQLCEEAMAGCVGVFVTSPSEMPSFQQLQAENATAPFYDMTKVDEVLRKVGTGSAVRDSKTQSISVAHIPLSVTRPLKETTYDAALRALHFFGAVNHGRSHSKSNGYCNGSVQQQQENTLVRLGPQLRGALLTRMNFADAAEDFAAVTYSARRRTVGVPLLVGTDSAGELFVVHLPTRSIFGLAASLGGIVNSSSVRDCVFHGVLSPCYRGVMQYRLILDDLLVLDGSDVREVPFAERWRLMETLGIEDEDSWPHAAPTPVLVLQSLYVPMAYTEKLLQLPSRDHATLGLVFTQVKLDDAPSGVVSGGQHAACYVWLPPTSFTVHFAVLRLEAVVEGRDRLKRAYLAVRVAAHGDDTLVPYEGEYVDCYMDAHPTLGVGSVLECMLRRAEDGAHWWDVLHDHASGAMPASSYDMVDTLVHSPGVTQEEMLWLLHASAYRCQRCSKVNDAGKRNEQADGYWCKNCWRDSGYGSCVYCGGDYVLGMCDARSGLFYCEACWASFASRNKGAEIGYHVPPPAGADFVRQVTTRSISLLVDLMNPRSPTNDVLELCCGGAVMRKWMRNGSQSYLGIDLDSNTVGELRNAIAHAAELPPGAHYDVVQADAFSDDFWTKTITSAHPRQFQCITCFSKLHCAFADEAHARHFLGSVSNALVPGGAFLGIFIDAGALYSKGKTFANSVLEASWGATAVPRIGNSFSLATCGRAPQTVCVIPVDFLIAVAAEFGLHVVPEAYQTFAELIEKDSTWMMVPSAEQKEYLRLARTFALRKESEQQAPSEAPKLGALV